MSSYSPTPITPCDRCGAEIPNGAKYCSNCGQAIGNSTSTFASSPPQPTPPVNPYSTPGYSYTAPIDSRGGIGKLFSGAGRIGRLEWFLTVLGIWLVLIVSWGIMSVADAPLITIVLGLGSLLLTVIVAICAGVKRLHDFGQTGWLYLLMLVPVASFILLIVLLFVASNPGRNAYGFEDSGSVMG